jgi:hypothetical protein
VQATCCRRPISAGYPLSRTNTMQSLTARHLSHSAGYLLSRPHTTESLTARRPSHSAENLLSITNLIHHAAPCRCCSVQDCHKNSPQYTQYRRTSTGICLESSTLDHQVQPIPAVDVKPSGSLAVNENPVPRSDSPHPLSTRTLYRARTAHTRCPSCCTFCR